MSTPKRKKEARQKKLQAEKKRKLYETKYPKRKLSETKKEFKEYVPTYENYRETKEYPSFSGSCPASTERKESPQYTGDYIVGIATSHKSNLVPVSRGIDPTDYATMRR